MTRTKRILALFLAVVLCFIALPFSVSADEASSELPTESIVESQPEEIPEENTHNAIGSGADNQRAAFFCFR